MPVTYGDGMTRRLPIALASAALLLVGLATPVTAAASPYDINTKATSWGNAAALLGPAGSLWEPARTADLARTQRISVIADNLTFLSGAVTGGDTFAGTRYGGRARSFQIFEKWAGTGFAAEPAFSTSMARVGTVRIPIGDPGMRIRVTARVSANCFVQPVTGDPREIPARFRCSRSDVLRTGGVLEMTARPPSTMTAPGNTSIVIMSTGLTYQELVAIASSLQQVAGSPGESAGSAQMTALCRQMATDRMTFEEADALAKANGFSARIGSIDGVAQAVTMDYRPDRFTVALVSNAVMGCTYG